MANKQFTGIMGTANRLKRMRKKCSNAVNRAGVCYRMAVSRYSWAQRHWRRLHIG